MGIVSTNVAFIKINGSGSGGANGADLPTRLKSISANGGNKFVTLTLGYENTDLVTGVQVNYKTGSYPTSPADGDSLTVTGAQTTIKITGLTNKLTYYFRVFLYQEVDGVKYYQTDIINARVIGIPRMVEIVGAKIFAQGEGYVVLSTSQTFTLSAPKGTKIIIGGGAEDGGASHALIPSSSIVDFGGRGGNGGYVSQYTLNDSVDSASCSLTIGNRVGNHGEDMFPTLSPTTLTIANYGSLTSGTSRIPIKTKRGWYVGGDGGRGGGRKNFIESDGSSYSIYVVAESGTGSGGGGGASAVVSSNYNSMGNEKGGSALGGGGGGGGSYFYKTSRPYESIYSAGTSKFAFPGSMPYSTYDHITEDPEDSDYDVYYYYKHPGCGGDGMSGSGGSNRSYLYCRLSSDGDCFSHAGCGGGGGFSGGGGGGGGYLYQKSAYFALAEGGKGGNGVLVIEWDE